MGGGQGLSGRHAGRDLKALADAGLLAARGERRGRHYVASDLVLRMRADARENHRIDDPFA
ncbi:MAG TPA: hypothetical protein DD490_17765 [Acidobacteria bacterium]|nr:hypothetical protein [Acidobacteriota bacterium]